MHRCITFHMFHPADSSWLQAVLEQFFFVNLKQLFYRGYLTDDTLCIVSRFFFAHSLLPFQGDSPLNNTFSCMTCHRLSDNCSTRHSLSLHAYILLGHAHNHSLSNWPIRNKTGGVYMASSLFCHRLSDNCSTRHSLSLHAYILLWHAHNHSLTNLPIINKTGVFTWLPVSFAIVSHITAAHAIVSAFTPTFDIGHAHNHSLSNVPIGNKAGVFT